MQFIDLTPELILDYRKDKAIVHIYRRFGFLEILYQIWYFIAQYIKFELRHIDNRVTFEKHICTMSENKIL